MIYRANVFRSLFAFFSFPQMVIIIYVCLLLFEDVPFYMILLGLVAHLNHIAMLNHFPFFQVSSVPFISFICKTIKVLYFLADNSFHFIALLLVNHYITFTHFARVHYHFTHVLSYFTICLWLIPFVSILEYEFFFGNFNVLF